MTKKSSDLYIAIIIILFTFELSFFHNIVVNLSVAGLVCLYFIIKRKYLELGLLIWLPFIPALGAYISFKLHASNADVALLLSSRTYAYAALGLFFSSYINLEDLLLHLEMLGIAPNFIYGLLTVLHSIPAIKREISSIATATKLRGRKLYFYSPLYYAKAIYVAFKWREVYTEAMYAHAYTEGLEKSIYVRYVADYAKLLIAISLLVIANILLFLYR